MKKEEQTPEMGPIDKIVHKATERLKEENMMLRAVAQNRQHLLVEAAYTAGELKTWKRVALAEMPDYLIELIEKKFRDAGGGKPFDHDTMLDSIEALAALEGDDEET